MVKQGKTGWAICCKYCDWETRAIMRSKKGKVFRGWLKLADHIMREHPEYEDVAKRLIEDYGE